MSPPFPLPLLPPLGGVVPPGGGGVVVPLSEELRRRNGIARAVSPAIIINTAPIRLRLSRGKSSVQFYLFPWEV